MIFVIQLLTVLLVLLSFSLIIAVPVALATPGVWDESKSTFYNLLTLWVSIVIITGLANNFI